MTNIKVFSLNRSLITSKLLKERKKDDDSFLTITFLQLPITKAEENSLAVFNREEE